VIFRRKIPRRKKRGGKEKLKGEKGGFVLANAKGGRAAAFYFCGICSEGEKEKEKGGVLYFLLLGGGVVGRGRGEGKEKKKGGKGTAASRWRVWGEGGDG